MHAHGRGRSRSIAARAGGGGLAILDPGSETPGALIRCAAARKLTEVVELSNVCSGREQHASGPSTTMQQLLDEAIAAVSGKVVRRPTADGPIAEINRQHRTAAAPPPTRPPPVTRACARDHAVCRSEPRRGLKGSLCRRPDRRSNDSDGAFPASS